MVNFKWLFFSSFPDEDSGPTPKLVELLNPAPDIDGGELKEVVDGLGDGPCPGTDHQCHRHPSGHPAKLLGDRHIANKKCKQKRLTLANNTGTGTVASGR